MVSEPVSKKFGTEKSLGTGLEKNWYRKKSRNRSRKNLVPKKSLGTGLVQILGLVTHCLGVKEMTIIRYVSKGCNNNNNNYGKLVCNFCTIKDPNSSNELHRVHKSNNVCYRVSSNLECLSCNSMFSTSQNLQDHIEEIHNNLAHPRVDLLLGSESVEQYVTCILCNEKLENDMALQQHKERVHEYVKSNSVSMAFLYHSLIYCSEKLFMSFL